MSLTFFKSRAFQTREEAVAYAEEQMREGYGVRIEDRDPNTLVAGVKGIRFVVCVYIGEA